MSDGEHKMDMRVRIQEIHDLPSLPDVADSITKAVLDEKSSADTIAKVVARDPAFATRVLRVVNSAYYGFYRQITSIKEAIALLGMDEVKLMAMAISSYDLFRSKETRCFNRKDLWMHGVAVAYLSDYLQKQTSKHTEEAYVAGLLHDIGKVVMDQFFPTETREALDLFTQGKMSFLEAEREVFGVDHGELGYLVAERWNLPQELALGIRYHHSLGGEIAVSPLTSVIHLADYFAWHVGYVGSPKDPPKTNHLPYAIRGLGLKEDDIGTLVATVKEGFKRLEAFLATC